MNWDVPISGFHIKFCHKGTWAITGDHANNLINLNVLERKILRINAVVNTSTPWGRQIDYQAPFAWLALLRNDPKTANMQTRKRGGGEGACNPAQRDFISQIRINNVGMVTSRGLVSFSWFKLVS